MHINELLSLKNRIAVIIGGAGKIGYPMAEALAEAGALVYIASSSEENFSSSVKKLKKLKLNVRGIKIDMSSEKSVLKAIEKIKNESGVPDILINSGCIRPMSLFMNDTVESWDMSMLVNARSMFITCRAFGREMAKKGSGSIINLSSIYGLVSPDMEIYDGSDFETEPDYPFIKGGIIAFSKYMASYLSNSGVRVNVIAPGGFFNNQKEPFLSKYIKRVPLGRMASHDDMKGVALYLASDASSYVTGTVIPVDGGWTAI